jgi:hypothetical protein
MGVPVSELELELECTAAGAPEGVPEPLIVEEGDISEYGLRWESPRCSSSY